MSQIWHSQSGTVVRKQTPHDWLEASWERYVVAPKGLAVHPISDDMPDVGGLYFLWDGQALAYVGVTGSTNLRILQHMWAGKIKFDGFSVIELDTDPHDFSLISYCYEGCYIKALSPPHNKRYRIGDGKYVAKMVNAIREAWKPE